MSDTLKQLKPYLNHILDEIEYLLMDSAGVSYEDFLENKTLKRSFVRALEVIGEATKSIPEEFRAEYSEIPWKKMSGLRDVLIHHYFGINYIMVWDVIKNQIPDLKVRIQAILEEIESMME